MKKKNFKWRALVFNPIVLVVYGIGCYYLSFLAWYGGVARRAPIILAAFGSLLFWFGWCFYQYRKKRNVAKNTSGKSSPSSIWENFCKWWFRISLLSFTFITLVTGFQIYQSAIHFQGKLAFEIHDFFNTRDIAFVHNNVYEYGLDGLLVDLQTELELPEELYLSNEFDFTFNSDGEITYIYSFFYGLDENKETKSFLLSYDREKSEDIRVYLNGFADPTFEDTMKLQPLIDGIKILPLKETVAEWGEETVGIYYVGYRSWGYNTEGIVYFDQEGNTLPLTDASNEITGYTISLYAPDNDSKTPMRFMDFSTAGTLQEEVTIEATQPQNDGETFFLNKQLGYQLTVVDAAAGSRFYTLSQSLDGGNTWELINPDPFLGELGVSTGIAFINEQLGFIGLSHNGGSYSELYRTTDGGVTFEKVEIPPVQVPLTETEKYNPFDFPEMPYEDNGDLFLPVGQGQDGDYNKASHLLYRSTDEGKTWEYAEELFW